VLLALALLLAAGPVGLALSHPNRVSARTPTRTLDELARDAGCRLTEYDADPNSNPPVSGGRVDERIYANDGSYVGRRPPTTLASVHALLHGRVVMQYRPDLPAAQVQALDRLVRRTPSRTLLFANPGMPAPVAATAYLTLMTCPRVDPAALRALRAFRTRRVGFGQGF
jgi:hypothetical protein